MAQAASKVNKNKSSRFDADVLEQAGAVHDFLGGATEPGANAGGGPVMMDIDLIDEDPQQPRTEDNPGFSPESIAEIGSTIKDRGIKTPLSVRENPEKPGRVLINHGARRYRGAKWAGLVQVPVFIDNDYSDVDQVIENLQRDGLTAREIADFIGRKLSNGAKKGEIAKQLGKSAAFVSQHVTLLDLPESIAKAFNADRVRDVTVVNELVTAHKKSAESVERFLEDPTQEITRGTVKMLRDFIDASAGGGGDGDGEGDKDDDNGGGAPAPKAKEKQKAADPDKFSKAIVQIEYHGQHGRLLLNKRPSQEGLAWLKYDESGEEFEAELKGVKVLALIEG